MLRASSLCQESIEDCLRLLTIIHEIGDCGWRLTAINRPPRIRSEKLQKDIFWTGKTQLYRLLNSATSPISLSVPERNFFVFSNFDVIMTAGAGRTVRRRSKDTAASEEESGGLPTPPDGGWGWVVVLGSFMIHVIADGVTYTFGIFFIELANYYGTGKGATSWIASILVGLTLGAGPLASALTNKYGCRAVTIGGSILASAGLMSSAFAENLETQYVCIGVCGGLGFGLVYLPAIVSVTCYFEKYRAFATGVAVCGSGVGTFIFAPLITEILLKNYAWQSAMLIVAGLVLNCAVFGALFRPVERKKKLKNVEETATFIEKEALMNGNALQTKTELGVSQFHQVNLSNGNMNDADGLRLSLSAHNLTNQQPRNLSETLGSHQSLVNDPNEKSPPNGVMYRKDIFYSGSLLNLPQYRRQLSWPIYPAESGLLPVDGIVRSHPQMYAMSVTHIPKGYKEDSCLANCCKCSKETRDTWVEMMNLSLFKDPVFVLFAISNFCTSIGFNVPYIYIKDRAQLLGVSSEDSSFLISIIGIANTISRVVLGYISDKPWLNRLWLYNGSLTICGVSTMFSALCLDYNSMAVYAVVFGATAGAYVGLTSVILVDLLGLEKLTNAFGLLLLFQGVASVIGPPITGSLYDWLESYDPGFYVAGAMIAASGLMLFMIPVIHWWQKRKLETKKPLSGLNIPVVNWWQQKKPKNSEPISDQNVPKLTVDNVTDIESAV
uniref:Major facilitator superfamily (MFS) profile domain-containing protein n=1 Tax=Strigamia maritima TaxID=126957 RepID=T1JMT4_STRMM